MKGRKEKAGCSDRVMASGKQLREHRRYLLRGGVYLIQVLGEMHKNICPL